MADEELGLSGQVAGDVAPQGATDTANQEADSRQTTTAVNLDDLPEGRALKSTYDKRVAALEREREMERAARLQAEQAADAARMESMNDVERLQYQLGKAQDYIKQQDQARQSELNELRRQRDIDRLAADSGAPKGELDTAETYDDAVAVALKYAKKAAAKAIVEREPEQEQEWDSRNDVDLGGGRPPPAVDEWDAKRLELLKARDPHAYTMHILGVTPGE